MSAAISEATAKRYGVQRVCHVWNRSRSTLYSRRKQARKRRSGHPPARRGPEPKHSDEALLAAIRADLARSPFTGGGTGRCTRGYASWTAFGWLANAC